MGSSGSSCAVDLIVPTYLASYHSMCGYELAYQIIDLGQASGRSARQTGTVLVSLILYMLSNTSYVYTFYIVSRENYQLNSSQNCELSMEQYTRMKIGQFARTIVFCRFYIGFLLVPFRIVRTIQIVCSRANYLLNRSQSCELSTEQFARLINVTYMNQKNSLLLLKQFKCDCALPRDGGPS